MGSSYIGPYVVMKNLGKGHFGKSRKCQTTDQYYIAGKIIEVLPKISKEKVMNEVTALYRKLDTVANSKEKNPLVRFRETVGMEEMCFGIITEYCPEGNLERHLLGRKDIQQILVQMKQIAQGVEWLHRRGTIHGDLKPANILLREGQLIISDVLPPSFRSCVRLRHTEGTYDYFPPQYFSGVLQPASDIWSLGLIFLEMIHGRRIRQLQDLNEVSKPSTIENYPSYALIAAVTHPDLQALIASMIRVTPHERADIAEVVARLTEMSGQHLQTKRNVALRQQVDNDGERSHALPLALTIDHSTPYIRHFTVTSGKVTRIDEQKIRVQAVSREKIPMGVWAISVVVVSYGICNDEVAVGFTTEERRYERMSGDIDQGGCIAYWSSIANAKGNLCLNGEWNDTPLPYLREGKNVLQMTVNTDDRSINWFVDSQWVRETPMPRNFWDQSLYFFVGLMGKNCSVQILQQEMHL